MTFKVGDCVNTEHGTGIIVIIEIGDPILYGVAHDYFTEGHEFSGRINDYNKKFNIGSGLYYPASLLEKEKDPMMDYELKFGDECCVWDDDSSYEEACSSETPSIFVCYTPNGVLVDYCGDNDVRTMEESMLSCSLSFWKYVAAWNPEYHKPCKEMTMAEIEQELGHKVRVVG